MEKPLISVIVPIYNTDKYTGICIESLINQRYKKLEIILVDDGSTDRCPEICDLYTRKDNRIKVIHKKNGGLVSGRKTGMQASTGDYVGYVDGDDWVGEGYFESVVNVISSENPDVVISGWKRVLFDQKVPMNNGFPSGSYTDADLEKLKSEMISKGKFYKHGISTYVWNKVFKRELVYDCQMNVDEKLMIGEDACVSYAALLKSKKVYINDNYDYHYRQHEDSMLKKSGNYSLEIERLNALHKNLLSFTAENKALKSQVDDYVLVSFIIRSGGLYPNNEYIFGTDFLNKRVVVYNAGTFGQAFVSKILEKKSCTLVGWIDDDYWEYRRCCLDVDPVEKINDFEFDYLIVAVVDGEFSEVIRERLLHIGVDKDKIITMEIPTEQRGALLNEYLGGL